MLVSTLQTDPATPPVHPARLPGMIRERAPGRIAGPGGDTDTVLPALASLQPKSRSEMNHQWNSIGLPPL